MEDMFYFTICLIGFSFCLMWLGWMIGYNDAKKEYKKKMKGSEKNESIH